VPTTGASNRAVGCVDLTPSKVGERTLRSCGPLPRHSACPGLGCGLLRKHSEHCGPHASPPPAPTAPTHHPSGRRGNKRRACSLVGAPATYRGRNKGRRRTAATALHAPRFVACLLVARAPRRHTSSVRAAPRYLSCVWPSTPPPPCHGGVPGQPRGAGPRPAKVRGAGLAVRASSGEWPPSSARRVAVQEPRPPPAQGRMGLTAASGPVPPQHVRAPY